MDVTKVTPPLTINVIFIVCKTLSKEGGGGPTRPLAGRVQDPNPFVDVGLARPNPS